MTIREAINILIDAPDKDKDFVVEINKRCAEMSECNWIYLDVTKIVNCGHSSVAETTIGEAE